MYEQISKVAYHDFSRGRTIWIDEMPTSGFYNPAYLLKIDNAIIYRTRELESAVKKLEETVSRLNEMERRENKEE